MSAVALTYSSFDTPPEASVLATCRGLDEYNYAAAPLSDVRQLATFATDASGATVGGAIGRTWGRCCELMQLWVEPGHRSAGVGSRLLREFEAHAARRGCDIYYLTTLSFQAPDFYRKHGYAPLAEIPGHPNGIIKYWMQKIAA